jgi:hypothetical protein
MTTDAGSPNGRTPGGDPIRPGLLHGLGRASAVNSARRTLVLLVGAMVIVVLIGVGLIVFSSMSRESQSYRDGYSVGGAVYSTVGSADETPQYACEQAETSRVGQNGRTSSDNSTQWIKGCVAAFNSAQAGN